MTGLIRIAQPDDDSEAIAAIYGHIIQTSAISFEDVAPSVEQMAARINALTTTHPWLVFVSGGAVQGYAYASPHRKRSAYRWSVEVSVYVAEKARRQGVGQQLYVTLFELLQIQGFVTAYAGITLPNRPSIEFHERAGFRPFATYATVGFRNGSWHDVGWWQLRLQAVLPGAPKSPLTVTQATMRPDWQRVLQT